MMSSMVFFLMVFSAEVVPIQSGWFDDIDAFIDDARNSISRGIESAVEDVVIAYDNSKNFFGEIKERLEQGTRSFKKTLSKKAELALKGAGDEVESFFIEVPNTVAVKVNDGFQEFFTTVDQAFTWVMKNVVAPILILIVLFGILYLAFISGCCGCCCSHIWTQCCHSLKKGFRGRRNTIDIEKMVKLHELHRLHHLKPKSRKTRDASCNTASDDTGLDRK
ncbi:hypothetical protein AB6A40_006860 [Gnathostoma spinigerum]|uniref:Uncharacterized protein n=1 Tax=Gnathostoma spinigerum TaxID=75299 RepID=A0ABD6EK65_9BILA